MLNVSNTISISDGITSKSINAHYVEFSHEQTLGKLEETVDGELVENYNGERLLIETKFWADGTLSNWLVNNYYGSRSKTITIDSVIYSVVLAVNRNVINLAKNKNFRGEILLKLKKKQLE